MIYTNLGDIVIRHMQKGDIKTIHAENLSHGWHSEAWVYEMYFDKQNKHELYVLVAEYCGEFAGYTTLRPQAVTGPFAGKGVPEVSDLNVFIKYRNRGIAGVLLNTAESIAKRLCNTISLGVGLHAGYGAAQRIYIKRGYLPDGSGVWYGERPLEQYANCCNDDDLVLYLSKQL